MHLTIKKGIITKPPIDCCVAVIIYMLPVSHLLRQELHSSFSTAAMLLAIHLMEVWARIYTSDIIKLSENKSNLKLTITVLLLISRDSAAADLLCVLDAVAGGRVACIWLLVHSCYPWSVWWRRCKVVREESVRRPWFVVGWWLIAARSCSKRRMGYPYCTPMSLRHTVVSLCLRYLLFIWHFAHLFCWSVRLLQNRTMHLALTPMPWDVHRI